MEFLYFIVRRLLWSLLVLFGLSVVIFTIARVVPGDPARIALGPLATPEQVTQLQSEMGLDLPIWEQYGRFAGGLVQGDLGRSLLTQRSVNLDIAQTFGATFELVCATVLLGMLIGVPAGVLAARNKDRWIDNTSRLMALLGVVTPSFFLAILLQLLAGYVLDILPVSGRLPAGLAFQADVTGLLLVDTLIKWRPDVFGEALRHLLLPSLALSAADHRPDHPHHPLQHDRRRPAGLHRGGARLRHPGLGQDLEIHAAAQLRAAADHPGAGIRLADRQRLHCRVCLFGWPGIASYGVRTILQKDLNAVIGVVLDIRGVFCHRINLTDRYTAWL